MHEDVTKIISETQYKGYTIKIVKRMMYRNEPFLYLYVTDSRGNDSGGLNYVYYDTVTKEDLADLNIALPKIRACIDNKIQGKIEWDQAQAQKKKEMNWTGRKFHRGDFVHYKGDKDHEALDTYVWTYFGHMGLEYYLIGHDQGVDRKEFLTSRGFADGFESVHSSQLQEGLKYLPIYCNEFDGETDELVMIKEAEFNKEEPLQIEEDD